MLTDAAAIELFAEALAKSGSARFTARGSSMRPYIPDGATLRIKRCHTDELRFGDIALCTRGGALTAHRFVARTRGGVLLKGDALGGFDEPAVPASIIGRVTSAELPGGRVITLTSPAARAINAAVLVYMLPASTAADLYSRLRAGKSAARPGSPAKIARAALELFPRAAAALISRPAPGARTNR